MPAYSGIPREGSLSLVGGRYFEHNNKIIIMIFYSLRCLMGQEEESRFTNPKEYIPPLNP